VKQAHWQIRVAVAVRGPVSPESVAVRVTGVLEAARQVAKPLVASGAELIVAVLGSLTVQFARTISWRIGGEHEFCG